MIQFHHSQNLSRGSMENGLELILGARDPARWEMRIQSLNLGMERGGVSKGQLGETESRCRV